MRLGLTATCTVIDGDTRWTRQRRFRNCAMAEFDGRFGE
jgi:hypothetical protein